MNYHELQIEFTLFLSVFLYRSVHYLYPYHLHWRYFPNHSLPLGTWTVVWGYITTSCLGCNIFVPGDSAVAIAYCNTKQLSPSLDSTVGLLSRSHWWWSLLTSQFHFPPPFRRIGGGDGRLLLWLGLTFCGRLFTFLFCLYFYTFLSIFLGV